MLIESIRMFSDGVKTLMSTSDIRVSLYSHANDNITWPLDVRVWITFPETYGKGELVGGADYELDVGPTFIYSKLDVIARDDVSGAVVIEVLEWLLGVIDQMSEPALIVFRNEVMVRYVVRSPNLARSELEAHIERFPQVICVVEDRIVPLPDEGDDDDSEGLTQAR